MAKTYITNIAGNISKSDLAKVGNSSSVNMYLETTNSDQNYVSRVMRSIPGLSTKVEISGIPRGMFTVTRGYNEKPTTYAVFDYTLYCIIGNEKYKIGDLAQNSSVCHFCETGGNGDAHPHVVLTDGINVYAVNSGLNIGDQLIDFKTIRLPLRSNTKDKYIEPTHCAYLYGRLVVNDSGTDAFYFSHQYPFENTNEDGSVNYNIFEVGDTGHSIQYTYSEWQPDNTLALCSNGSRLFTFGSRSYQVFQYNDNIHNPFSSPDTAAKMVGIKAINSLAQLGDYTLWLGSADIGNNGIYLNTGSVDSTRVSTTDIERQISKFSKAKDATAQIWQENQHIFYAISFPSANKTFVYDIKENAWHERCSLSIHNEEKVWRYNFATMGADGNILYATEGAVVQATEDNWTEHDDWPMLRKRIGGVIYAGYDNFYIDALTLDMNNGQYYDSEGKELKVTMRFTADGSDWSDLETVNVGGAGDYDYDCTFYNFGMARCFSIEFSTSDNFPFAIYGLKLVTQSCKW